MEKTNVNPFGDYGTIVRGNRFIGREQDIQILRARLLGRNFGSIGIIGMSRIGKSSLVHKVLIDQKDILRSKKILVLDFNIHEISSHIQLFRALLDNCIYELKKFNVYTNKLEKCATETRKSEEPVTFLKKVHEFFVIVKQKGIRVIVILDEFDDVRKKFNDHDAFFWLRGLASDPRYKIGLVLISKRELSRIACQIGGEDISYWCNVFHKHYLLPFQESDVELYYKKLNSAGIELNEHLKKIIHYYCGHHPFFLDLVGFFIVDEYLKTGNLHKDRISDIVYAPLQDEYKNIIMILKDNGYLDKLLQIIYGPIVDLTHAEIKELERYGIIFQHENNEIRHPEDSNFSAFSQHFSEYLRIVSRQVELWPMWSQTEKNVRGIVNLVLKKKYGDDWLNTLGNARPSLKKIFDKWRKIQSNEQKAFGSQASSNLLDFSYPKDIFIMIESEWTSFNPIFGEDINYWKKKFYCLAKVRNPLAHNRVIHKDYKTIAEEHCRKINYLIEKYKLKN